MVMVMASAHRRQSTDQFHRYLNNPHIVQPDGLDSLPRTKGDQQQWLNTEQWDGYSATYLKRHMQYPATQEHTNPQITPRHDDLYACLGLVYELYGSLADELQVLHDNPLHPRFHQRLARVRRDREKIAEVLDKCYADLHPTMKTVYDAFLVRRYYHLDDWATYVERKRADILERLSPEYIAQVEKMKGLSEDFIRHLKLMETVFQRSPTMGMLTPAQEEQYTEKELVILKQKVNYYRNMKQFGINQLDSDVHTH